MVKLGKRFKEISESVDSLKIYEIDEAIKLVKNNAKAKFNETIEIVFNLGVDPKQADQMVRGVVKLPEGTGKEVRVAVFARDVKAKEAKDAGADIVGDDDLAETVKTGKFEFDRVISTPDMMAVVGQLGKILEQPQKFLDEESNSILYQDHIISEWQTKIKENMFNISWNNRRY